MAQPRIVELFMMLLHNSAIAERGLTVRFNGSSIDMWRGEQLVGSWMHDGDHFVWTGAECRSVFETVNQAVNFAMASI